MKKLMSVHKIIMLSHYNNFLSAIFRYETRFIDPDHGVMKVALMLELE